MKYQEMIDSNRSANIEDSSREESKRQVDIKNMKTLTESLYTRKDGN
jgi:hypothetical protein